MSECKHLNVAAVVGDGDLRCVDCGAIGVTRFVWFPPPPPPKCHGPRMLQLRQWWIDDSYIASCSCKQVVEDALREEGLLGAPAATPAYVVCSSSDPPLYHLRRWSGVVTLCEQVADRDFDHDWREIELALCCPRCEALYRKPEASDA